MLFRQLRNIAKCRFSTYSSAMYEAWKVDNKQVHSDWDAFFNSSGTPISQKSDSKSIYKYKDLALSAYLLIRYYKARGHERAELDPLRLVNFAEFGKVYIKHSLDNDLRVNNIINYSDYDIPFTLPALPTFCNSIAGFLKEKEQWTLREIDQRLNKIYSNKIGLEFIHISDPNYKTWLMHYFYNLQTVPVSKYEKMKILFYLTKTEAFNTFLSDRLKTSKRFGVYGLDSMISGLNRLVEYAVGEGIEYIGMGMAHRGRLNALANVFNKPLQMIFAEFQESLHKEVSWGNSGDVKYHLGTTIERSFGDKKIKLSILPNPSHLYAVNPVVMGHVKAVYDSLKNGKNSLTVIIHGDAAVAGQGLVYECLQMAYLNHYNLHGVIHIVANNQIGFTTTPAEARTGLYCTEVAKSIQAPILHVNADEPELVNAAMKMAILYRQTFSKDIFIDLIGYRRYGHNEQDQPSFTQPMMYQYIDKRPNIYKIYSERLLKEGVVTTDYVNALWNYQMTKLKYAYTESSNETFDIDKWKSETYYRVVDFTKLGEIKRTGLKFEDLRNIGEKLTEIASNFNINPTIKKIYENRKKLIEIGDGIDFGTAESLAFGSLLLDGFNIRLSGQDVYRGTFSHRHAVLVDQKNYTKFTPLHSLLPDNEKCRVKIENSLLSYYAALGYYYGYAMTSPNTLTIWYAQFGDFANGAQIIIDNYLSSGESKWSVQNGLVLNLPHGMDGQGPEHSSARMERYLQMSNDSWTSLYKNGKFNYDSRALKTCNMQVICCSHAGNLFHAMRRQMRRDYRKPLINFVNKKLLKLKEATTNFATLNNNHFDTIIDEVDSGIDPKAVKKVVLLYGQAYYAALYARTTLSRKVLFTIIQDTALIRVEQIAPFHYAWFMKIMERYPNAKYHVWFQYEHRNSGAWSYLSPRISMTLYWLKKEGKIQNDILDCVSRKTSASTAAGKKKKHDDEQAELLKRLFSS